MGDALAAIVPSDLKAAAAAAAAAAAGLGPCPLDTRSVPASGEMTWSQGALTRIR
jgi:hypothetical protein